MNGNMLRRAMVFHAVGVAGGISAAGERLGKSPPAVHADLRRFEREVGAALTERVGRSIRLTHKGRTMFDAIGRALGDIDRACASASDPAEVPPPLRLGAVTGFGRYRLVPALLPRLASTQSLLLRTDRHDALIGALTQGEIDLAVTYRPVVAATFEARIVASEELVLVGADGADPVAAVQDGSFRFVTYDEYEYVFARWFAEALGGQPPNLPRHDHFDELEEALASVAAGRGATIAPADACAAFGLAPCGPPCSNAIYLVGTVRALATEEAELVRQSLAADRAIITRL